MVIFIIYHVIKNKNKIQMDENMIKTLGSPFVHKNLGFIF